MSRETIAFLSRNPSRLLAIAPHSPKFLMSFATSRQELPKRSHGYEPIQKNINNSSDKQPFGHKTDERCPRRFRYLQAALTLERPAKTYSGLHESVAFEFPELLR